MPSINLLPWREELREERKTQFYFMLAVAGILAVLLIGSVHSYLSYQINGEKQRNTFLQQQIALLDAQITEISNVKKQRGILLARMTIIQELEASRSLIVHLFDQVVRLLPPGVYLDIMERVNKEVTLVGKSESNSQISAFMRNIEHSNWLVKPVLQEIITKSEQGQYKNDFRLLFRQKDLPTVLELSGLNSENSIE